VEVECETLVTLLVEAGQLSELGPIILVGLLDEFNTIERYHTSKVLLLSLRPPEGEKTKQNSQLSTLSKDYKG
jgi:hypothetical protein